MIPTRVSLKAQRRVLRAMAPLRWPVAVHRTIRATLDAVCRRDD